MILIEIQQKKGGQQKIQEGRTPTRLTTTNLPRNKSSRFFQEIQFPVLIENLRSSQPTDARVSDFLGKFWRERKTRDDQGLTVGGGWIIERVPELSWLEGRPQIMVTSTVGQLTAPLSTYPQLLPAKRPSQAEVKSIGQETQMPFFVGKNFQSSFTQVLLSCKTPCIFTPN